MHPSPPPSTSNNNNAPNPLTIGVLALQGAFVEHISLLQRAATTTPSLQPHNLQFIQVRTPLELASCAALILPGGTTNADTIRTDKDAVALVKAFKDAGKPIGVICHGGWILTEADLVKGVKLTSVANVKTDLVNAGANWVDEEVVVDSGFISSRTPDDLPAFNAKLVEEFAK